MHRNWNNLIEVYALHEVKCVCVGYWWLWRNVLAAGTLKAQTMQYPLVETNIANTSGMVVYDGGGGGGVGGRLIFLNLFIITPSANVVQRAVSNCF